MKPTEHAPYNVPERERPVEWISELSSQNFSKRAKGMTSIIVIKNFAIDFTLVFLQSHTLDSQIQILR